ncbi:hypothetical protein [Flavisericum labens]|uniref:hypothetical protein n=1 Tax=Flavisericum labens TaxID=3377112 RepID=UPI00387ACD55
MRDIKKIVMLVVALLLAHAGWSQKTAPDYQYAFDGQVKWLILHESGTLLASTGEALTGIRPNSHEVSFKLERLKRVKEEHLEFVPNTPYVIIKPRGIFMHTVVVDVVKGKIVFDSKAENWQNGVSSRHFLGPEMMFVVNGMHKEEGNKYTAGVGLYDLKTGKLVNIFERKPTNPMIGQPDIMGDNIIIPGMKNVECYSISSAVVRWTADIKNATSIVTNEDSKEVYAFRSKGDNTVVYKINSDTGASLWSEGNKIKGVISTVEFTEHGLAIVTNILSGGSKLMSKLKGSGTSKVYLLDLNSGADLWDKSPKTKGIISHFYIEDDGILFGVSDGGINKMGFDGTPRWKKPLKTGPSIQIMATVPKGLLYISETDADIIDMATGESVFGKPIKYKRSVAVASAYDKSRNRFLITCKDGVYEVDGNSGAYDLIANDTNFEGKEDPTNIEVRDEGILLTSSQNMEMLEFQGNSNWHVYHRAPGKSAFGLAVVGVLTLASATASISHSASAGYMKGAGVPSYNSTVQYHEQQAESWANVTDAGFQEMAKRFKATKATANSAFILTKVDEGVALIKVDKDSGETLSEVVINDKNPMYEVDDIAGFLYYKDKGNNISAFDLNN